MSHTYTHPDVPIEPELVSAPSGWVDRLMFGIWPKPLVFWAVVFYIGLFIIRPWEKLFPELASLRFERIAVIAVVGLVCFRRGVLVRLTLQNVGMILLFTAVYLSGRLGVDPTTSGEEVTEFLGFLLIFFLIQKAIRSPYQTLFLIACYLLLTTAYVGKSLWEYAFHGAAQVMMGVHRLAGIDDTYGHPNTIGRTMLCSLPFAIYFYRTREQFCVTWSRSMRWLFRITLLCHMLFCLVGIFLTRSRSAVVGLAFFALLIVVRQKGTLRRLQWGIATMAILLGCFFLAPTDIQNRIRTIWDDSVEYEADMRGANASKAGRYEGFVAGLAIFQQFPMTGVGIGNFADYRERHIDGEPLNAHNLPGELLGEVGTVGTVAFAIFFFAFASNLRKLARVGRDFESITGNPRYRLLSVCLIDSMLVLLLYGLVGHTLQAYHWYFFPAFALISLQAARGEYQDALAGPYAESTRLDGTQQDLTVEDFATPGTPEPTVMESVGP